MQISWKEHFASPFSFDYSSNNVRERACLNRNEKIKTIALAVLIGLGTALIGGIVSFFLISAYYKGKKMRILEASSRGEVQPVPFVQKLAKTIDQVWDKSSKTSSINKNQSFIQWVHQEYKSPQALVRLNIEDVMKTIPLNDAHFLGMRGNGDCTIRALGNGLFIRTMQSESEFKDFYRQIQTTNQQLLDAVHAKNDQRLTGMIEHFEKVLEPFEKILEEISQVCQSSEEPLERMIQLCLDKDFDQTMILYLRAASCLQTALLYLPLVGQEEACDETWFQYLLFQSEGDVMGHLYQKLNHNPDNPLFFGNIVDAFAISHLFNQAITWITVEDRSRHHQVLEFNTTQNAPIYLLNRAGHTDLIVMN